jgi:predicted negative regulator of RcsB-dependent stress response
LLESTLKLAQTHLIKGSAKQAEAYATQAHHLASELGAGIWKAKASLVLAAIHIKTETLDKAKTVLEEAKDTLEEVCRSK